MTSDLSDQLGSLKLSDDRVRLTTTTHSPSRRTPHSGSNQRPHLHAKRAATIDHESHEEKLRIVILGATKVGQYFFPKIIPREIRRILFLFR